MKIQNALTLQGTDNYNTYSGKRKESYRRTCITRKTYRNQNSHLKNKLTIALNKV
jgi:hypothetical protein